MTTRVPTSSDRSVYGASEQGQPGSIAVDLLNRIALLVVAVLGILVLLPALVGAAGSHLIAIT